MQLTGGHFCFLLTQILAFCTSLCRWKLQFLSPNNVFIITVWFRLTFAGKRRNCKEMTADDGMEKKKRHGFNEFEMCGREMWGN